MSVSNSVVNENTRRAVVNCNAKAFVNQSTTIHKDTLTTTNSCLNKNVPVDINIQNKNKPEISKSSHTVKNSTPMASKSFGSNVSYHVPNVSNIGFNTYLNQNHIPNTPIVSNLAGNNPNYLFPNFGINSYFNPNPIVGNLANQYSYMPDIGLNNYPNPPFVGNYQNPLYYSSENTPNINMNHASTNQPSNTSNSYYSSKLSKIRLKDFWGNIEDWESFWDVFDSHVHSTDMPNIFKFTYLIDVLKGDALDPIQGIKLTSKNYPDAIDALKDRYEKPDLVIQSHIQALLGKLTLNCTATSGPKFVKALYNFYDEVVSHIRSLSNLGIRDQLMGVCISPIILSKLPHSFRLEWYKSQELDSNLTGNLGELLKFIKRRISSLEKAAQISSDQNTDKTVKLEVKDKSDKSFRRKPKQKANCVLQTQSVKGQTGEKPK